MAGGVSKITEKPIENVVGTLSYVDVGDIDDSGRLRPVDPVAAEAIAASLRQHGLLNPIDICRLPGKTGYRLVAGGHRLAAAKLLGWSQIPAFERSANALERKSREIAENLFKAGLSPLDRAAFVRELMEVEKARLGIASDKDGRAMNPGRDTPKNLKKQQRDDLCTLHKSFGMQESVAARLGLTQSTVSRDLALNGIAPSLLPKVRTSRIADNAGQLRALAKLHPDHQAKAVELIAEDKAKTVAAAVAIIRETPVETKAEKRIQNIVGVFARLADHHLDPLRRGQSVQQADRRYPGRGQKGQGDHHRL
jgi:ParB family chromosome partitioning protein